MYGKEEEVRIPWEGKRLYVMNSYDSERRFDLSTGIFFRNYLTKIHGHFDPVAIPGITVPCGIDGFLIMGRFQVYGIYRTVRWQLSTGTGEL